MPPSWPSGRDFGLLRFNTAIARLTELVTVAARLSAGGGGLPRALAEPLVLMMAPLAPHIAEELWSKLGHTESLAYEPFPVADPRLARARVITVPVQVNGRTRFRVEVPATADADDMERAVVSHADYARCLEGGRVDRMITVPGRIVNIIVREQDRGITGKD